MNGQDIKQPPLIRHRRAFFDSLLRKFHDIGLTLLACLDQSLGGLDYKLADHHRERIPSTCAFGILKYSPLLAQSSELGHGAHTDVGSLTILFCTAQGLQFQDPKSGLWSYIDPRDGHAIINVGDSLRHLSRHRLNSCLHRVVPLDGKIVDDRLSCAYFLRPNLDVEFLDEEGKWWKSVDWHARKYAAFRAPLNEQRKGSVLTGKPGYVGLWKDTT
jgi:isopenicillin N synthase-like dioxygenase